MVLTLGLSSPVPMTIRTRPRKNVVSDSMAMLKCPSAMMQPPRKTERRCPRSWSAIHPPGRASR
jgi:hypothetical protein